MGGLIIICENIPFTPKVMAKIFNRTEQQIDYALGTFARMGMIEVKDENVFLCNFIKHHPDIIEREQTRKRVDEFRKRKRLSPPATDSNRLGVIDIKETQPKAAEGVNTWQDKFLTALQATGKCPSLTCEGLKVVTRCFDETKISKHWGEIVIEAREHSDHVLNNPVVWLRAAISRLERRLINLENKAGAGTTSLNFRQLVDIPETWRD